MVNRSKYKQQSFDHELFEDRIKKLSSCYTVPHFSVIRSDSLKKLVEYIPLNKDICPIRIFSDEYLPTFLYLASGKIGKIKEVLIIRDSNDICVNFCPWIFMINILKKKYYLN